MRRMPNIQSVHDDLDKCLRACAGFIGRQWNEEARLEAGRIIAETTGYTKPEERLAITNYCKSYPGDTVTDKGLSKLIIRIAGNRHLLAVDPGILSNMTIKPSSSSDYAEVSVLPFPAVPNEFEDIYHRNSYWYGRDWSNYRPVPVFVYTGVLAGLKVYVNGLDPLIMCKRAGLLRRHNPDSRDLSGCMLRIRVAEADERTEDIRGVKWWTRLTEVMPIYIDASYECSCTSFMKKFNRRLNELRNDEESRVKAGYKCQYVGNASFPTCYKCTAECPLAVYKEYTVKDSAVKQIRKCDGVCVSCASVSTCISETANKVRTEKAKEAENAGEQTSLHKSEE